MEQAWIRLYEPNHDHLKTKTKHKGLKRFVWVVEIGPFMIVKPSENSAYNFLTKMGYVLSDDCTHYVPKYKSEQQIEIERNYTIVGK